MKIKNAILSFFILTIVFACENSKKSPILVDGSEFPAIPASAVKEVYADNENLIKVTINGNQGNILSQGDYYFGLREGAWTEFHPNAFPQFITSYVNGYKQGVWISFDNRGQLLERGYYSNDQLHGNFVKYNRTRLKEERFYQNGQLAGSFKKYYDNGNIMEESTYKNGKLDGSARWYDQEGNVTIEYQYVDGEWINPEGE